MLNTTVLGGPNNPTNWFISNHLKYFQEDLLAEKGVFQLASVITTIFDRKLLL